MSQGFSRGIFFGIFFGRAKLSAIQGDPAVGDRNWGNFMGNAAKVNCQNVNSFLPETLGLLQRHPQLLAALMMNRLQTSREIPASIIRLGSAPCSSGLR